LIASVPDVAVAGLDPGGRVVGWSLGAERLKGYTVDEMLGRSFTCLYPEEAVDAGFPQRELEIAAREGRFDDDGWHVRKDGSRFWANTVITALRDRDGRLAGFSRVTRDRTAEREAEEQLRASEERLRLAVEAGGMGVWDVDMATGKAVWSGNNFVKFGYEPTPSGEATYEMWRSRLHPDDRDRVLADVDRARRDQTIYTDEHRVIRVDNGEIVWLAPFGQFHYDEAGAAVRFVGVFFDITARKKAEEALRDAERRFHTMADNSPVLIWMWDVGGAHFVNRHYLEFFGQPLEALAGTGWVNFLHPDDGGYLAAFRSAVERQERYEYQCRFRRHDGEYRWLHNIGIPHYSSDGAFVGFIGCSFDVTDSRRALEARDDFVAVVAHDLRNPLTAVKGQIQMVRRRAARGEVPAVEQLIERLDTILSSIGALSTQIDELHDATRLQAGRRLDLRLRPTDLVALARECVASQRHTSDSHQLRFETAVGELIGTWDAARLERVIANLLSNAIKYSPSGGDILVQVSRDRGWAVASVADHGLGIPVADLPLVFERFRRASNVSGQIAGSGLGLAGARDIVEQHGGTISVQSEEGRGSTFVLYLPLNESTAGQDT
jgi:PAS domain S-box-containing protein